VVNSRDEVKKLAGMVVDHMRELVKAKAPIALNYRLDRVVADWEIGADGVTRGPRRSSLPMRRRPTDSAPLTVPRRSPISTRSAHARPRELLGGLS